MRTACFIPIKANSERVPGKNFRILNGKKLYCYICEHVKEAGIFDDIFVDTNSQEIADYAHEMGFEVIEREPWLATDAANGNDIILHHFTKYPNYDFYFQVHATAPFLQPKTIRACCELLLASNEYDSCFTATKDYGYYWFSGQPVNYRPGLLPRSQDMEPVIEETTGLYGVSAEALKRFHCRIGKRPLAYLVDQWEAVDINTEDDLRMAELIGQVIFGYKG